MALTALALNCTLKPGGDASLTELMLGQVLEALRGHDVTGEMIRVVDHDVKPGVTADEGPGDAWPLIRQKILAADILIVGTPTWLGHHSSVCQRVLERMDAFLSDMDDDGRFVTYGKVAAVAVTGNEDGAHHITAELYQAPADVGFTIPANGVTYWNGEAMGKIDYKDLPETPEKVASTNAMLARNAAHLARLLQASPYPPAG